MVDIHHHLLAGPDDGARDQETSLLMAGLAAADGITHIVCTPHANDQYPYDRNANESLRSSLQQRLIEQGIPIILGLGCDFHLNYQNVKAAIADPGRFTINATQYLLVELPDYGIPPTINDTFLQLEEAGLRLILTHPERNMTLAAEPWRMLEWLRHGMLVQVTANSVTGEMGRQAQRAAHHLLGKHWVDFVATDAHNMSSRPPRMKAAHDLVGRRYGSDYANLLCHKNPLAAFLGEPIDIQRVPEDRSEGQPAANWLGRLFRRQR